MAKAARPIRNDKTLLEAAMKIEPPSKREVAFVEAPLIKKFAIVLRMRTINQTWTERALALDGKCHERGNWEVDPRLVWVFPSKALPQVTKETPGIMLNIEQAERVSTALGYKVDPIVMEDPRILVHQTTEKVRPGRKPIFQLLQIYNRTVRVRRDIEFRYLPVKDW